jgi:hypothetical protein
MKEIAEAKLPTLLPTGSSVTSFECRSSICRLETAHKDHADYVKFAHAAFMSPTVQLWNAATYTTPLNDDPADGAMVTYLSREGQALPQIVE